MEKNDALIKYLKGLKPSFLFTILIFIIGMIVPGVCGLALYDLNLFKELDLVRILLIAVGISSPALITSMFLIIGLHNDIENVNSIEGILLIAGFISIAILIAITFLNHSGFDVKNVYFNVVSISLILSPSFALMKFCQSKKKQNNKVKAKEKTS